MVTNLILLTTLEIKKNYLVSHYNNTGYYVLILAIGKKCRLRKM